MEKEQKTIITPVPEDAGSSWQPEKGSEMHEFLSGIRLPDASKQDISRSAFSILSKGVSPACRRGQETGLVIGYVQSGKTMSFEAVTALASDNKFQIVIIIAGTTNPLLNQSISRLQNDLRLGDRNRPRRWTLFKAPFPRTTKENLENILNDWRVQDESVRRTALIVVLKNHKRLQALTELIGRIDVQSSPALIIDDEGDQASLNTGASSGSSEESKTYHCLMNLRKAFPIHTFLQYTATPQAPLLISITDLLSPNFVQVLDPGKEYVGGKDFFGENQDYVRLIPAEEIPTSTEPLDSAPETLQEALGVFIVGVASGLIVDEGRGNRSMLVHPSHRTEQHWEYDSWIRRIRRNWERILALPDDNSEKLELKEIFKIAYEDLKRTVGDSLPPFDKIYSSLSRAIRHTQIQEINTRGGTTPQVDWQNQYGWILVGGQAIERGFTVEGLTVTYMPRSIGVGNADVIQQRARFFGYKRPYLGYCRVYLTKDKLDAFKAYVKHEEDIRNQLGKLQEIGRPLNTWKRNFILDESLKPCRRQVIEFDYIRGSFVGQWVSPKVHLVDSIIKENRKTLKKFLDKLEFKKVGESSSYTEHEQHDVCQGIPLKEVLEELLIEMKYTATTDIQRNTLLLLQLKSVIENSSDDEVCTIYRMSPSRSRQRQVDSKNAIRELFQGRDPSRSSKERGNNYPGDRSFHDDNVTVQVHKVNLVGVPVMEDAPIPVLAVWVPERLESLLPSRVVQGQP